MGLLSFRVGKSTRKTADKLIGRDLVTWLLGMTSNSLMSFWMVANNLGLGRSLVLFRKQTCRTLGRIDVVTFVLCL